VQETSGSRTHLPRIWRLEIFDCFFVPLNEQKKLAATRHSAVFLPISNSLQKTAKKSVIGNFHNFLHILYQYFANFLALRTPTNIGGAPSPKLPENADPLDKTSFLV
jgi:hypothetical protein